MNSAAMKGVVQKSDCAQRAGGASDLVGGSNHLLEYFNSLAPVRDRWIEKNWFYHRELARTLCFFVPAGSSVVEIGSSTGVLLNDLRPTRGLGLDFSPAMVEIAQRKYPHL